MMKSERGAEERQRRRVETLRHASERGKYMEREVTAEEVLETYGRIAHAEMTRGVEFVRERLSGVTWEHIALAASTSVEDVRSSAILAFWGVEPVPA